MAAVQLSFSLRTSSNVRTVHLLGSWDNYAGQLPLSKDTKPGAWKGTFRFQNSVLAPGKRYWYYYIVDGYHASHDPANPSTTEPTTGRALNILDVPSGSSSKKSSQATSTKRHSKQASADVAKGRGVSPSNIKCPKPQKPYASRQLREADYTKPPTVEELADQYATTNIEDSSDDDEDDDDDSSLESSISNSSSDRSSPSSLSSLSDVSSVCRCERYGITRKGDRVKIDCGGSRCGYSSDSATDCSSESDSEVEVKQASTTKRQAVVMRR